MLQARRHCPRCLSLGLTNRPTFKLSWVPFTVSGSASSTLNNLITSIYPVALLTPATFHGEPYLELTPFHCNSSVGLSPVDVPESRISSQLPTLYYPIMIPQGEFIPNPQFQSFHSGLLITSNLLCHLVAQISASLERERASQTHALEPKAIHGVEELLRN